MAKKKSSGGGGGGDGTRLTEELAQLLANLHLGRIAECFDDEVRRA